MREDAQNNNTTQIKLKKHHHPKQPQPQLVNTSWFKQQQNHE